MANYNTFVVVEKRKPIMESSSIRKCAPLLKVGSRIEVWNENQMVKKIYARNRNELKEYVEIEKEFVKKKQEKAERKNLKRKRKNERK